MQNGVYEMKNGNRFIVSEFESEIDDGVFEAHRKFLDIHIGISGNEVISWENISKAVPVTDYISDDDYHLFSLRDCKEMNLRTGKFILFSSDDVHKCGMTKNKKRL